MNNTGDPAARGFASHHGLQTNVHGRAYKNGHALSLAQKVSIANSYAQARNDVGGARPNISTLARACKVLRNTTKKVEFELASMGRVLDLREFFASRGLPTCPGIITLSDLDAFILRHRLSRDNRPV